MHDNDEALPVVTKSLPTAGAIYALTGVVPDIIKRQDGSTTFQFPPSCDGAMVKFLKAKRMLDGLLEGK